MGETSQLAKTLNQIGLSEKEALVYEALLNLGKSGIGQLLKKVPLKRGNTYNIVYDLINKGLIYEATEKGKKVFVVEPPDKLQVFLEEKVKNFEQQQKTLNANLVYFQSIYRLVMNKPGVRYYEGERGIKAVHQKMLQEKKEILSYALIDKKIDMPLEKFWIDYYKQRKENGIHVRSICPDNPDGIEYKKKDNEELRKTRLVPYNRYHFSIEKNICGDKIAFMSLKEKIGIIIHSKEIAETEKEIFELTWEQAEKYNR